MTTHKIPRNIPMFLEMAYHALETGASARRMAETHSRRVLKRFSMVESAEIMGINRTSLYKLLDHPDAPKPLSIEGKRETTLSLDDIMLLRLIDAATSTGRRQERFFWRKPRQPLRVITFASQKGGTAKTSTVAAFAHYLLAYYGLRVGVIDADPQATCSLYLVNDYSAIGNDDTRTFTEFMGVPEAGGKELIRHDADELDKFWLHTPWPGLRLIPGGSSIQEADIAITFLRESTNPDDRRVYRLLKDAIARWEIEHPPRTEAKDLFNKEGRLDFNRYQEALTETLDVILIDTAPALTTAQLNAVIAADQLVIPQTMKGPDLRAVSHYLGGLHDFVQILAERGEVLDFQSSEPFILPTIVSRGTDADVLTLAEIYAQNSGIISPVFYRYSDGAANAFRDYQTIYEHTPERARRGSANAFKENANAVNDYILIKSLPHLPSRGYAEAFREKNWDETHVPRIKAAGLDDDRTENAA